MNSNLSILSTMNWLDASQRIQCHPGSWNFEYLEGRNRATRVYSHSCTMAYLDDTTLKIIIISAGKTPTGKYRVMDYSLLHNDMVHFLLDAEDIALSITTHAPGLTEEDLLTIETITLVELVVNDLATLHMHFAIWALQYLPPEQIFSENDLNIQLDLLLALNTSSYVAGLASTEADIAAILAGGINPVPPVEESIVRVIEMRL